jgi:hypothetical protein
MLSAERPDRAGLSMDTGPATRAACGRLVAGQGVTLVWPDGERTPAVDGHVTGLGPA